MGIGCVVVARCTCHMPAARLRVTARINSHFFSSVICLAVNVAVHLSSHSFPMDISAPGWRWGEMCSDFYLLDNKEIRLSLDLLVSYMRLPYRMITHFPFCVLNFFTQGVSTLM